ncbi:hypothetical protein [Chryseobacterium sp. T1]
MKNIFIAISLFSIATTNAQVAIGKQDISKLIDNTTTNPSISLEFYDQPDNVRGIVLPWTSTVPNSPVTYNASTGAGYKGMTETVANGTLILDLSDKRIKYMKGGSWFNLTGNPSFPLTVKDGSNNEIKLTKLNNIDSSIQDNRKDQPLAQTNIGAEGITDTTSGILVLSDSDKTMVLPKVASPHLNIQNPAPGMMAYDTVKRQLAVYNGTIWSFWKP